MILALDLGTTNWKAALLDTAGQLRSLAHIPTPMVTENGFSRYDPLAMPEHLRQLLGQLDKTLLQKAAHVALTGMAEAGLILDRETLKPRTMVWPWFDQAALPLYDRVHAQPPFAGREGVTGLPNSFKYGIYKFLTLLEGGGHDPDACLWMGLVAYAATLLTGSCAEDVTIAARTFCVDIHKGAWDEPFLHALGLRERNFPRLVRPGETIGYIRVNGLGIPAGILLCIGGHDHVCAAHASGLFEQGGAFLSSGTAQVVLSMAGRSECASVLSFGPAPAGMPFTFLGSIQSAGGAINYWKKQLFPQEGFGALLAEAEKAPYPTRLMMYPYLTGSGAPHLNAHACGAILGLRDTTARGEIVAAAYEGIALETRYLLDHMPAAPARLICTGGLTRHRRYMQALADVTGLPVDVPALEEGTLYGAARLAAPLPPLTVQTRYAPDENAHARWTQRYQQRYIPMMDWIQMEE